MIQYRILLSLALAVGTWATCSNATLAAGNFAFAVAAPAGLELTIAGYDSNGGELFRQQASEPETIDGGLHYVTRVDETALAGNRLSRWCVTDATGQWSELPQDDPHAAVCDDRPSETRGTYLFQARLVVASRPEEQPEFVAVLTGPDAVACVQTELNELGFNAGIVDGQLGRGTRTALSMFMERQLSTYKLPTLDAESAGLWCAHLQQEIRNGTAVAADEGTFNLIFGEDVTAEVREETHAALADIGPYLTNLLGYSLKVRPAVYVSSDPEWMADNYLAQRDLGQSFRKGKVEDFRRCNGGEASYGTIFMCAKSDVFSGNWFGVSSIEQRKFALTHEYMHMIQFELAGERAWSCCTGKQDSVELVGPQWLVEGAAEYLAFVIVRDGGWSGYQREIDHHRGQARRAGKVPTQLTSRSEFYAEPLASSSGMIGAHLLSQDPGFPSYVAFWSALGNGEKWSGAFEGAFGISPQMFDARFAEAIGL